MFFGLRRFEHLYSALGCARNLLSGRLTRLVNQNLLDRVEYHDPKKRPRYEYRLTEKGAELISVLMALLDWGDRWTADPAGPAVDVRHRGCCAPVHVTLSCDAGHAALTSQDLQPVVGAGARRIA